MEFRLLGPVEMWDGGRRVDVGHAKQRSVLAVLLLEAGHAVPTAVLMDRVWGNDPPDGALNVLYAYIARLRKAMASSGVRLIRRSGGYLLDIDPDTVDVHRFHRLSAEAAAAKDHDGKAVALDETLALWRSTPFADTTSPWLVRMREALADQRRSVLVDRNEAYLAGGRHAELVGQLRELVAQHPLDERLIAQLMMALYRSGRAAEALDEYQAARQRLIHHRGSDPSPQLRRLQQRMLCDDPSLALAAPSAATCRSRRACPTTCPASSAASWSSRSWTRWCRRRAPADGRESSTG